MQGSDFKNCQEDNNRGFSHEVDGKERNDRGEVHVIPSQAGAMPEMHPFSLMTLATSERGGAGTHPHYLIDEDLGSERLCDVPKFPQF